MLASHLALLREGHLDPVFHIYAYLRQTYNSHLVFDLTYPVIDENSFKKCNWKDFYDDISEAIPTDASKESKKEVDLWMYTGNDHTGDKLTR